MIFNVLDKYVNGRNASSDESSIQEDFNDKEKWAQKRRAYAMVISPSPYTMIVYWKVENINLWGVTFTNGDYTLVYMEEPEFDKLLTYLKERP